ncbi:MAG: carboxylating nicotinate-nucleotide diphosphorylase [bacterium]
MILSPEIKKSIEQALQEDLEVRGDVTCNLLLPNEQIAQAVIVAKQGGVIAGTAVACEVFKTQDARLQTFNLIQDGAQVQPDSNILKISGSVKSILSAERTALNFLQRLSGIATMTQRFVACTKGTAAKILDTRKTSPGLRRLEKYAVRVGGGVNHRMGLFDMILIKENHLQAAGSITAAVNRIRLMLQKRGENFKIEVECTNLQQVKEALNLMVDQIMLDNMTESDIYRAVEIVQGKVKLEVSGGVHLENVARLAKTGVDFISVGALTHSAPAMDLSLLLESP